MALWGFRVEVGFLFLSAWGVGFQWLSSSNFGCPALA